MNPRVDFARQAIQEIERLRTDATTEQAAAILLLSVETLEELERQQMGPRFYVDKDDVKRYTLAELDAYTGRVYWGVRP